MTSPGPSRAPVVLAVLTAGLVLVACQDSGPAPDGGGGSADLAGRAPGHGGLPSIRARLHLERLRDGRNADQDDYHEAIGICEAAGLPVKALTGDQVARLDTAVVELMSDAQRRLSRETRWERSSAPGPEGLCLFEFAEVVSERYMDAQTTGWSDGDGTGWQEAPISPEDFVARPVNAEEEAAIARQLGWTHLGDSQASGQPCQRWRNEREESCMWSGGHAAGYSSAPSSHASCFGTSFERFEAAIPLEVEPVGGNGCRIRAIAMEVGEGTLPAADVVPVTREGAR